MSFFDRPDDEHPKRRPPQPPPGWSGAPGGVLPALSSQRAVLICSDEVIMFADRFLIYPDGLVFFLSLNYKESRSPMMPRGLPLPGMHPGPHMSGDDFPQFGIQFGDGTKWTDRDQRQPSRGKQPDTPIVICQGGSGSDGGSETRFWIWPLPPPGPLTFVASWPSAGIDEIAVELDSEEFRQRSLEARRVWD